MRRGHEHASLLTEAHHYRDRSRGDLISHRVGKKLTDLLNIDRPVPEPLSRRRESYGDYVEPNTVRLVGPDGEYLPAENANVVEVDFKNKKAG
jgi:hypothetical protein